MEHKREGKNLSSSFLVVYCKEDVLKSHYCLPIKRTAISTLKLLVENDEFALLDINRFGILIGRFQTHNLQV